jgi:magnesium chelatase subunit D
MPVPFIDLPLGATEDRVVGTLDFERALREARRSFQPGLLAAAHRGILYIDEVNLLANHLVDVLLDAAALGVNTVEREGIAMTHPARFLLIGTMNPEEGDLRPQLLDRFGLVVSVTGTRQPELRAEVVRRRLAFERDPARFAACWQAEQAALREKIVKARALLPQVVLEDGLQSLISRLCCEFEVDGLRADIVLHKAACALAAFHGCESVSLDNVRAAAELVLPHRQRRRPFEQPELNKKQLDRLFSDARELGGERTAAGAATQVQDERMLSSGEAEMSADTSSEKSKKSRAADRTFPPEPVENVRRIEVTPSRATAWSVRGRRNPSPAPGRGLYTKAVADETPTDLALDATIRAAAQHGPGPDGQLDILRSDLHQKERSGRTGTLILFVVDASGSMAARRRMEAVKGAVLGLLQSAYEQRDQVGVIAFRGPQAEVLLPPTTSVELAQRVLSTLPTGGRTPLAHALILAQETLRRARRSLPELLNLVVLLSDGKANVALPGCQGDPWQQALAAATELAAEGAAALVVDTEAGFVRHGRAESLAEELAAECLPLEELSAETLILKVRQRRHRIDKV